MANPGKAPSFPLFLVTTEAPRAEKNFLETGHPRLSEGLDRKKRGWGGWGVGGRGAYNLGPLGKSIVILR